MTVERWNTPVGELEVTVRNGEAHEAIIMVAGQAEYVSSLDELAKYLDGYATYQIELPGRGESGGRSTYENDVSAIVSIAGTVRERHARVYGFGHSLGSVELLDASERARFDKLIASGHPIVMQDLETRMNAWAARVMPWLIRTISRLHRSSIPPADLPAALASYVNAPDLNELLPLETPTLFLYGAHDRYSGPRTRRRIRQRIGEPHAWAVLSDRNHGLSFRAREEWGERDNAAKEIIARWIASV